MLGVRSAAPGFTPTILSCGTLLLPPTGPGTQQGTLLPLRDDEFRQSSWHQSQAQDESPGVQPPRQQQWSLWLR